MRCGQMNIWYVGGNFGVGERARGKNLERGRAGVGVLEIVRWLDWEIRIRSFG